MIMPRSLAHIFIVVVPCLAGIKASAAPKSDVAQLRTQLPPNFERPVVSIFPATDFAHLKIDQVRQRHCPIMQSTWRGRSPRTRISGSSDREVYP